MMRSIRRLVVLAFLLPLLTLSSASRSAAQTATAAQVEIVGNTMSALLFDKVTLGPGQRMEQRIDVSSFVRLSFLAAAETAPNLGRVAVNTRFGPPPVPVPNHLALPFNGGIQARRSEHMPVMGPDLSVEIVNQSTLPVQVSVGLFASK